MDAQEHIKEVIKDKVLQGDNPYVKSFIISNLTCDIKTRTMLYQVCDSLMEELGFRFKIEFQPECCILKCHKIPNKKETPLQILRARNNYARAHLAQPIKHAQKHGVSTPEPISTLLG